MRADVRHIDAYQYRWNADGKVQHLSIARKCSMVRQSAPNCTDA